MRVLFSALLILIAQVSSLADDVSWSLLSPDGKNEIVVGLGERGALTYRVTRGGKTVLLDSPLGLRGDDWALERGLKLATAGDATGRREQYELFTGPVSHVDQQLNGRTLEFQSEAGQTLQVELAASDQGVAFRYRLPEESAKVHVVDEERTGFRIPRQAAAWLQPYHAAGEYTPAYEDFYFRVSPGDKPPKSRAEAIGWAFPALFHLPEANCWALITESGTDGSYCGCHLAADSEGGLYRIAFAAADEGRERNKLDRPGPEPRSRLPWKMPWRVIVLGDSAGDLALANLVTDLAPPSKIADTSWIRPGRASWSWWSYPDGPHSEENYRTFSDFAARMDWEYTLFDAGWWEPGLDKLSAYARKQGLTPLAWTGAEDFYDAERADRKLDEFATAKVAGVKVDFWCSDRQEAIAGMHDLFERAAKRKMTVNLHGCTLPRGWQRTWPNFLTAEAVVGSEHYFYEPKFTEKAAELNTILPFTRNAVGPMDYTPIGASPKKYERRTTAAHELATSIVFTSGIIHFADGPKFFESLPQEALQVLKEVPARWDESRCLAAEPGQLAVFARRSGKTWYIAGINGSDTEQPISLDLTPFAQQTRRLLLCEAGVDATMKVGTLPIPAQAGRWNYALPPRGGFIVRLGE
jgi:alpha-glucosidase